MLCVLKDPRYYGYSINYPSKNYHVFSRKLICIFFIPSVSSLQVKKLFWCSLFRDLAFPSWMHIFLLVAPQWEGEMGFVPGLILWAVLRNGLLHPHPCSVGQFYVHNLTEWSLEVQLAVYTRRRETSCW